MLFRTILLLLLFFLSGCEKIAIMSTPKKQPIISQSQLSIKAEQYFWNTLHMGRYGDIPTATKLLTAAYLANPNDPNLTAHLGFLHIWRITERARSAAIANDPLIVNEIILARKYFTDAVELNPGDARYQGFLGDSILVEGKIFNDQRQQTRGYFQLKRAIRMWPEFNYFSAGYPMSTLNPHSKQFQEGLEWQWKTVDLCAGEKVNRMNPNFNAYMYRETHIGSLRACWNSWITPHNFEGFFLNMGDMLVKSGNWHTGIKIYENARLSKDYNHWPYKEMLEKRIRNAQENVANFQHSNNLSPDKTILFNSGYGCAACHQR